jgi:hypothetical protein
VLEALERQFGATALALLTEKVPRRLLPHASLERLRASAALDTISLDDGEELLLFIDSLLGEGTGRVLEGIGQELASRALGQGGVTKLGDLHGTVARLQAFLDHPFVDTPTVFELKRTDLGFALTVGVVGRPRATRVIKHLAVGAVLAAERAAREGGGLKLSSDALADRATISARYQRTEPPPRLDSDSPPTSVRRPAQSFRPPSLSEEVERILTSHRAPPSAPGLQRNTSSAPPPLRNSQLPPPSQRRSSQLPPPSQRAPQAYDRTSVTERDSEVQPVARPSVPVTERSSEVQPVARPSAPDGALDRPSAPPGELKRSKG